jgi:tryptophanyl-tRNA synthetase
LFEAEESIRKKVRSAITDTGEGQQDGEMSPGVSNLFNILKSCNKDEAVGHLTAEFKKGSLKYSELKDATADALVELTSGLTMRKKELMKDEQAISQMLKDMSAKASEIAAQTIRDVKELAGLPV